jgi:hypothetical protein
LVDHDGEGETRVQLSFCHDKFRGLIDVVVRAIPIDDNAIDSAADHVRDLIVDLACVGGTVAYVYVIRSSEPQKQVRINLCACSRIQQRVHVYLADVACTGIAIGLGDKSIRGARVVRRLSG